MILTKIENITDILIDTMYISQNSTKNTEIIKSIINKIYNIKFTTEQEATLSQFNHNEQSI